MCPPTQREGEVAAIEEEIDRLREIRTKRIRTLSMGKQELYKHLASAERVSAGECARCMPMAEPYATSYRSS